MGLPGIEADITAEVIPETNLLRVRRDSGHAGAGVFGH